MGRHRIPEAPSDPSEETLEASSHPDEETQEGSLDSEEKQKTLPNPEGRQGRRHRIPGWRQMTYVFCHRRPKGIKHNRKCKSSQPKQVNDRAVQLFEEVRATKLPINGSK